MVTRNRQRECENEPHYHQGGENQRYRLADFASWQDKVFFNVTIPVLVPVPEPPAAKSIEKTIVAPSPKLKRAQKATKQRDMKPEKGWHWTDYYRNQLEWRTVRRNVEFFSNTLNYCQDESWMIRRCEFQYEGENDLLEA